MNMALNNSVPFFDISRARFVGRPIALVLLIALLPSASDAASFDCYNAHSVVEEMVCANATLSHMDEKLALTYREARKVVFDKAELRKDQLAWLERRNVCEQRECIATSYRARYAELRDMLADPNGNQCKELRELLDRPDLVALYMLDVPADTNGRKSIDSVDVDGDGVMDTISWWCPGSKSVIPPDPCQLSVEFASGDIASLEVGRFYLVRVSGTLYAIAEDYSKVRENRPEFADIGKIVYRIDELGANLICSSDRND